MVYLPIYLANRRAAGFDPTSGLRSTPGFSTTLPGSKLQHSLVLAQFSMHELSGAAHVSTVVPQKAPSPDKELGLLKLFLLFNYSMFLANHNRLHFS